MRWLLALFVVLILGAAAGAQSLWEHNGSVVRLDADGPTRKFVYEKPRAGLPVQSGTTLFVGKKNGHVYSGTAYAFSARCRALPYSVAGPVSDDLKTVTLHGRMPVLDRSCQPAGDREDTLVFNLQEKASTDSPKLITPGRSGTSAKDLVAAVEANIGSFSAAASFQLSPNETILAVDNRTQVSLWDMGSGRRLRSLASRSYTVAARFLGERRFVTAHKDGSVLFWDLETGAVVGQVSYGGQRQGAEIRALDVGQTGATVAVTVSTIEANPSHIVSLIDARQQRETKRFRLPARSDLGAPLGLAGNAVGISDDEKTLYAVAEGIVGVWDIATGQKQLSYSLNEVLPSGGETLLTDMDAGLLGDGTFLYTSAAVASRTANAIGYCQQATLHALNLGNPRGSVRVLDEARTCENPTNRGNMEPVSIRTSSIDLAVRGSDRSYFIGRLGTPGLKMGRRASRGLVPVAAWVTPEFGRLGAVGRSVAVFVRGRDAQVRRLSDGALVTEIGARMYEAANAFASPDGRTMALFQGSAAAADRYHQLMLWDVEATSPVFFRWPIADKFIITDAAFAAGVAVGTDESGDIVLISTKTGDVTRRFPYRWEKALRNLRISPDGQHVAVIGESNARALLLAAVDGAVKVNLMQGTTEMVNAVAFSSDGQVIAVNRTDQSVEIWSMHPPKKLRTIPAPAAIKDEQTRVILFSKDGRWLLGGTRDAGLLLWDVSAGRFLKSLARGGDGLAGHVSFSGLAISPDGQQIAAGLYTRAYSTGDLGSDNKVLVWDGRTGRHQFELRGHDSGVRGLAFSANGLWLVSGSYDGTIKYWDRKAGRPVATVSTTAEGRWSVVTDMGLFAGSPNTGSLLSLRRGLKVVGLDQVWQSLFSPDLVRAYLSGDPDGEVAKVAKVLNLEKVLDSGPAPSVTIELPAMSSQSDLVRIAARIEDRGKGVGRIEWRVNGITAAVAGKPAGDGPVYTVTKELALDPGDNAIEVVAYNGSNLLASLPASTTVKFQGPADKVKPKLHILAIGINKYEDKGWGPPGEDAIAFGPLGLAVKDATAFADTMRKSGAGLYDDVRVTLALDEDATRDNLPKLIDKVAAQIHPRDTFILFAAAHGFSEDGWFYLIPQDYQHGPPGTLARRAIGQDDLQEWLGNRIKARRALVLLDTCESGALVAGHSRSRTDSPASEASIGRLHEATGRPVLTAAAAGQFAYEGLVSASGQRHGVFTWAVLDALYKGDTNGNGTIELSELVAHVQRAVPEAAATVRGRGLAVFSVPERSKQSARFGSRGEDFVVARRLQ